MISETYLEKYIEALMEGDRRQCRSVIEDILHHNNASISGVYCDILWPAMLEIDRLYKRDRLTAAGEHIATAINRTIASQLQNKLPRQSQIGKRIAVCTSACQSGELGGQMLADMFESCGWDVHFLGGGLSSDDILGFVHNCRPDVLAVYGTQPSDAPQIRGIIDRIKEIGAQPDMKIMLCGGVFARADGLWEEIGADMFAENPIDAVRTADKNGQNKPTPVRTINQRKRKQPAVIEN